jgi:hypothetical protein
MESFGKTAFQRDRPSIIAFPDFHLFHHPAFPSSSRPSLFVSAFQDFPFTQPPRLFLASGAARASAARRSPPAPPKKPSLNKPEKRKRDEPQGALSPLINRVSSRDLNPFVCVSWDSSEHSPIQPNKRSAENVLAKQSREIRYRGG